MDRMPVADLCHDRPYCYACVAPGKPGSGFQKVDAVVFAATGHQDTVHKPAARAGKPACSQTMGTKPNEGAGPPHHAAKESNSLCRRQRTRTFSSQVHAENEWISGIFGLIRPGGDRHLYQYACRPCAGRLLHAANEWQSTGRAAETNGCPRADDCTG